jgi:Putative zinc-binding metallo-peptidase
MSLTGQSSQHRRPIAKWTGLKTDQLLEVRLCDLGLSLPGSWVAGCIARLHDEVKKCGLLFKPYFWISDEWFTPDRVTGIAVPFYLLHPRLLRLERTRMGYIEGATVATCMRVLRHETGHALDHAFGLHRRRRWQRLFGLSSDHYPRAYRPNPYSQRHVQHLDYWYAQSHPDEDFAETFAVWLAGPRYWRRKYADWPALDKLEYLQELMTEIAGEKPQLRTRNFVDPLSRNRDTLKEYYLEKSYKAEKNWPALYDADLKKLFGPTSPTGRGQAASAFIRQVSSQLRRELAPWLGPDNYHLQHVLMEITGRCRELKLRASTSRRILLRNLAILLTKYTTDSLYRRRGCIQL